MSEPKYRRILLKLSGEALMGKRDTGIDFEAVTELAQEILEVKKLGVDIAIVNGAGNLFRGKSGAKHGMDQASADYIGMVATVMNSLALQNAIENVGGETRVMSALEISKVAELYIRRRAIRHMEKGRIVICAGGTGNPFFTTDTAGVLRALELNCEIMLKASNVDGVYDSDPDQNKSAKKFEKISYQEFVEKNLQALDQTAVALAREKSLPIEIFNFFINGNLKKVVCGERIGTLIG